MEKRNSLDNVQQSQVGGECAYSRETLMPAALSVVDSLIDIINDFLTIESPFFTPPNDGFKSYRNDSEVERKTLSKLRSPLYDAIGTLRVLTPHNDNSVQINDLPDDCLLHIFADIPLQAQIGNLRPVCTRWAVVIEREICEHKRTVQLFSSIQNMSWHYRQLDRYNMTSVDYLNFKPLGKDVDLMLSAWEEKEMPNEVNNIEVCDFLLDLFPNVEHLLLSFASDVPIEAITYLIQNYSPSLKSLALFVFVGKEVSVASQIELFKAINSCQNLKRLDINRGIFQNITALQAIHQVLPPLEQFAMYSRLYPEDLKVEFDPSKPEKFLAKCDWSKVKQFHLYNCTVSHKFVIDFLSLNATAVTDLRLDITGGDEVQIVSAICDNLSHLKKLDLKCLEHKKPFNFQVLTRDLIKLKNLTDLCLRSIDFDMNMIEWYFKNPRKNNLFRPSPSYFAGITALKTVKTQLGKHWSVQNRSPAQDRFFPIHTSDDCNCYFCGISKLDLAKF